MKITHCGMSTDATVVEAPSPPGRDGERSAAEALAAVVAHLRAIADGLQYEVYDAAYWLRVCADSIEAGEYR